MAFSVKVRAKSSKKLAFTDGVNEWQMTAQGNLKKNTWTQFRIDTDKEHAVFIRLLSACLMHICTIRRIYLWDIGSDVWNCLRAMAGGVVL